MTNDEIIARSEILMAEFEKVVIPMMPPFVIKVSKSNYLWGKVIVKYVETGQYFKCVVSAPKCSGEFWEMAPEKGLVTFNLDDAGKNIKIYYVYRYSETLNI